MPEKPVAESPVKIPLSPLARRFVRMVLGFGVGIGLGLAPFLGKLDLPGFSPLLSLFPEGLKKFLLPTSAFLMGVIGAGTQFYSGFKLSTAKSRKYAQQSLAVILSSLFILLFLYFIFVERVHFREDKAASYVIGLERKESCPCGKDWSDADCIQRRSANPNGIEGCWPKVEVALGEFFLSLSYLVLTGSFAIFIGILILRESEAKKKDLKNNKPKPKPRRPSPPPKPRQDGT